MVVQSPSRQGIHPAAVTLSFVLAGVLGIGIAVLRFKAIGQAIVTCADEPTQVLEAGGRLSLFLGTLVRAVGYPVLLSLPVFAFWRLAASAPRRRAHGNLVAMAVTVLAIAAISFWIDFEMYWSDLQQYGSDIGNVMSNRCAGGWPPWWPSLRS